ncbi:MAG: nuclear transport factor 2 family protein [Methylobacteriaceae bacterium]|nr:nuclear transport factor 2 family protein [Methylobacteriaceae bacterium]
MKEGADEIAAAFIGRWESAWNSGGAAATAQLYAPDALLVGQAIGVGRGDLERLLGLLHQQGWTRIAIKILHVRETGEVVLVACQFTAFGSGPNAGKSLQGKSTHVLTRIGESWMSAMHTAG